MAQPFNAAWLRAALEKWYEGGPLGKILSSKIFSDTSSVFQLDDCKCSDKVRNDERRKFNERLIPSMLIWQLENDIEMTPENVKIS